MDAHMETRSKYKRTFIQPKILIFIFLAIAVIMIATSLIEIHQSRKELVSLMEKQAHSMLETVIIASTNTILTNEYLEDFLEERLINNAYFIRYLYERGDVTNDLLSDIAASNHIHRINIFDAGGNRVFSSHDQEHFDLTERHNPRETLAPIFEGTADVLIIGLREARFEEGFRYAVAVAIGEREAIVLNLDAANLIEFQYNIGFGTMIRDIANNPGIMYVVLQDYDGIIAASEGVRELERIEGSTFLEDLLADSIFATRMTSFQNERVFEAVHPFYFFNNPIGLFRIGFSVEALDALNARILRRLIIISVVLIVLGSIVISLIVVRQNLNLLQRQYNVVESYSGNIIRNVSDAIIVLNPKSGIQVFNHTAEKLFEREEKDVFGKTIDEIFDRSQCESLLTSPSSMVHIECTINERIKSLLVSKSSFTTEDGDNTTIFVIRDLTEQRRLEEQIQRTERMTAMGELASGVAHEIRNPLNTIATIIQQLKKDFLPENNIDEYRSLANIIYQEVRRINNTVQQFLRFSRPEPVRPEPFLFSDMMKQLEQQYRSFMTQHTISFSINVRWDGYVEWDRQQMRQALLNVIRNAVDAVRENGEIAVSGAEYDDRTIEIRVRDNGRGIPGHLQSRIFNLYFTTKANGTGIGLSIVQRTVYEHGGLLFVESAEGEGTTFIIRLPKVCN
jgi:two-component system, NtrC family, sensor histidine kinase HydH